jgi:uncharacterized RDD family membrane protein YckC
MSSEAPPKVSVRVSEFYERKRRLAYVFAVLSMVFLAAELALGSLLELSSHPRVSADGNALLILHRCLTRDNPEGSRVICLDPAMKLRHAPLNLVDSATAVMPEGEAMTIFYGTRASLMTGGSLAKSLDLKQKWDVLAAVADPAGPWIFGWNDGKIVARRRSNGTWGDEIEVARSGAVDRLTASPSLVAWREKGKNVVRTVVHDGAAFVPRAEFEVAPLVQHWDAVLARDRILFAHYNRDDRAFQTLTLRFACCPGCPSPVAAKTVVFVDPLLRAGRRVSGVALAVTGDRLRFFVSRTTAIMTASAPLETLRPEAGARLAEIPVDPLWRNVAGAVTPTLLVFFSCALVFLGITLLAERARIAAGGEGSAPSRRFVGLLPRAMAYVLDFIVLFPACVAVSGVMAVSIEDFEDPHYLLMMAIWGGIEIVYRFGMEWALGWTLGKRILGLRVTEVDGSRLTLRGALVRNLTRIIDSQVPFGVLLGIFLMLKTERRQRLGDLFGRTVVVQDLG